MSRRVLVVDDDAAMVALLVTALTKRAYVVTGVRSGDEALAALNRDEHDVCVTDLHMPGMGGLDLCRRIVEQHPDVPVVVLTAFGSFQTAVEAIRAGAYDFVTKPVQMEPLAVAIERAVQHRLLRHEVRRLERVVEQVRGFGELIGNSPPMQSIYDLMERVADADASILVTGESGTGKEVVARALHRRGRRKGGPFLAINCAAIPEQLLESELFGHARGAFTDARSARTGLLVQAHGGTVFLDEIGELPLALQPKLLRALQERTVRPLGASQEVPFDARIVTATNRDLESAVEQGRFREDLYFRINVVQLALPPLRVRGNDILLLAQHFLEHYAQRAGRPLRTFRPGVAQKLLAYPWPGNVRELQNAMERAVTLARYEEVTLDDLPERIGRQENKGALGEPIDPAQMAPLEEVERRYVLQVLEACGGNRSMSARVLGLDRKTLRRKLERYGVRTAEDDGEEPSS